MIRLENVKKNYGNIEVLKGINLNIEQGDFWAIKGKSGAGKSTLLHIIGTIDEPDSGKVYFDNILLNDIKGKKLADLRNQNIGFVFQFHHLLPEFNAIENVMIPGYIAKTDRNLLEKRAAELLDYVGLKDRTHHKPSEMSGGEQQRVAIARALINQPKIILADEPTGNLDSSTSEDIHKLFTNINQAYNTTLIIVTHNDKLAEIAKNVYTMKDGLFEM